eukprot:s1496_g2.t1
MVPIGCHFAASTSCAEEQAAGTVSLYRYHHPLLQPWEQLSSPKMEKLHSEQVGPLTDTAGPAGKEGSLGVGKGGQHLASNYVGTSNMAGLVLKTTLVDPLLQNFEPHQFQHVIWREMGCKKAYVKVLTPQNEAFPN